MGEKSSDTSTFYKYSRAPPPGPGRKTRYACNHMTRRTVRMRRRCGSLRKRARFIASALNTIKITVGSKSRRRKRGAKRRKKKEKALYGKQWQFSKDKGTREKFRENNGTDFISPWFLFGFYARFDRTVSCSRFSPDRETFSRENVLFF